MNNTNEFSFVLKPSAITGAGVGVFATHQILAGTKLYLHTDNHVSRQMHKNDVPAQLLKLCIAKDEDTYICPEHFNRVEIGWYVNHSSTPNATKREDGWHALADIEAGDEILMDYNQLGEPASTKEAFYSQ